MHLDTDALTAVATDNSLSGVIRVDAGGDRLYEAAFGLADRAHGVANTMQTRFGTASASKAFTALAVLSLVDGGTLELDDPARRWLGDDLSQVDQRVTLRQLLSHTSGVGEYLDDDADPDSYLLPGSMHEYNSLEDFVRLLDVPMLSTPGSGCVYSNAGYVLLGLIAQRASGMRYQDLVRERVIEPAGLQHTGFLRSDALPGDAAIGYLYPDALRTNVFHLPIEGSGDGGAYTTAADLHAFWPALAGGAIVPEALVELMTTRSSGDEADYVCGLGIWLPIPGVWGLEGSDAGVSMMSQYLPSADVTWSVLSNESDNAWEPAEFLMAWSRDVLAGRG
ncbi:MAG: beta-lactamase family protein [Micropruina sp.]|nr:beta-lactamase family protein [Micropruina sp.]